MANCVSTNCDTFISGLADLYVKAAKKDNPCQCLIDSETVTDWSVTTGTVTRVTTPVKNGAYSARFNGFGAGDSATYTFTPNVDFNTTTGYIAFDIYPSASGNIQVSLTDGTATVGVYSDISLDVIANEWNRIILDLTDTGFSALNLADIDLFTITFNTALGGTAYVDNVAIFCSVSELEGEVNGIIGCLTELSIELGEEFRELRCNGVLQARESKGKEITITGTVQNWSPYGMAIVGGGEVESTDVIQLIENELHTIPDTAPYTVTLDTLASTIVDDGCNGLVIIDRVTGCVMQRWEDPNTVPAGYYAFNADTGVVTFNGAEAGRGIAATYNATISNGNSITIPLKSPQLEICVRMLFQASNGKKAYLYFPRVLTNISTFSFNADDFHSWEFSGTVIADGLTDVLGYMHQYVE